MSNSESAISNETYRHLLSSSPISHFVAFAEENESSMKGAKYTPVNGAPIAVGESVSTLLDTAITIAVLLNDSDPEGDALSLVSITAPASGTAVDDGSGQIIYTPDTGFLGNDAFSYTIQDTSGNTATANVAVTVSSTANDVPVAVDDDAPGYVDTMHQLKRPDLKRCAHNGIEF